MQASKKCPYIDFKLSDYLFTFCDSVEGLACLVTLGFSILNMFEILLNLHV